MLDSSRHFLSMKVLLDQLDLMEMNKFNVFHWHLSDDESFPYQSTTYPNMSLYGAYDPVTHVYTPDHVKQIIEEVILTRTFLKDFWICPFFLFKIGSY